MTDANSSVRSAVVLGRLVATPNALAAMERNGQDALAFLGRHTKGDWGDVSPNDAQANNDALAQGERLFSVYRLNDQSKIWIITEADRSVTTVLLPEDY